MTEELPRALCPRCRRPEVVCYCAHVRPLTTRTRVVILQHPRERDVPINTARIAALCLPDAALEVGLDWSGLPALADPTRPAILLYPGEGAIDVEKSPPAGPVTLVVVDGTWAQAQSVVRKNPRLAALPRYAVRPAAPSDYRIRREPHESYVSTIEALAQVLGALEGDPARFATMLDPFRAMVEAQLEYARSRSASRHAPARRARAERPRVAPAPLRALHARAADLVCVHGEANAWPYRTREKAAHPDELVQWVARRLSTGEMFEAIVAPRAPLAPSTSWHVGVPAASLLAGESLDAFRARWRAFVRPTDALASWGRYAPSLLARAGGHAPATAFDLRQLVRLAPELASLAVGEGRGGSTEPRAGRRIESLTTLANALVDRGR